MSSASLRETFRKGHTRQRIFRFVRPPAKGGVKKSFCCEISNSFSEHRPAELTRTLLQTSNRMYRSVSDKKTKQKQNKQTRKRFRFSSFRLWAPINWLIILPLSKNIMHYGNQLLLFEKFENMHVKLAVNTTCSVLRSNVHTVGDA